MEQHPVDPPAMGDHEADGREDLSKSIGGGDALTSACLAEALRRLLLPMVDNAREVGPNRAYNPPKRTSLAREAMLQG
jgi:hypothetical protein